MACHSTGQRRGRSGGTQNESTGLLIMRGLFIRTIAGIFAIIIAGIAGLVLLAVEPVFMPLSLDDFKKESAIQHRLLMNELEQLPEIQWREYLKGYQSYYELTAELYSRDELPEEAEPFTVLDNRSGYLYTDDEDDSYAIYASPSEQWLVVFEEGESVYSDESDAIVAFLVLLVGPSLVIILAMLVGIGYLLYAFSRPLQALENALSEFSHNQRIRLEPEYARAMPHVVEGFNQMADQLEETLTQQQVMIAAIPHELRTPVARIRFALDMLRTQQGEGLMKGLERLDLFVDELQQAAEDILLLSRLEQEKLEFEKIDIQQVLKELLEQVSLPDHAQIQLSDSPLLIQGHFGLLQRALSNLLDNAFSYQKHCLEISISEEQGECRICFKNDGASLNDDEVGQILQPFFRADSSRSRDSGGTGIGLTLVDRIIRRHKGRVDVDLICEGMLQIELKLPLNSAI